MYDYLNEWMFFCGNKNGKISRKIRHINNLGMAALFNELCSVFCGIMEWESDDYTIDCNSIEKAILFNSCVGFWNYGEKNVNVIPYGSGDKSFYGKANSATLYDYRSVRLGRALAIDRIDTEELRGELKKMKKNPCVLCYDTPQQSSPILGILYYAERLGFIQRQINSAIKNIFGMTILEGEKEQVEDIKAQRRRAEDGETYMVRTSKTGSKINHISDQFNIDILNSLYESYDKSYARFLNSVGIKGNTSSNKMSGVNTKELFLGQIAPDVILSQKLKARQDAVKLAESIGINGLRVRINPAIEKIENALIDGKSNVEMGGDEA